MSTWPIYEKHFLQLILTKKKNFHCLANGYVTKNIQHWTINARRMFDLYFGWRS